MRYSQHIKGGKKLIKGKARGETQTANRAGKSEMPAAYLEG